MTSSLDLSKIDELPEEIKKEIYEFIEFKLKHYKKRKSAGFTFNWVGGLKDLRDDYTSVELQHESSEWR